jgi:type II secretory pathway component GspD/PulD (secretin)
MNNGQAIVLGGLIQDRASATQTGVPVLGEVPLVGALFRNPVDQIRKTELVVLLKSTIIEGNNIHDTDKDLYRGFSQDRRPFQL